MANWNYNDIYKKYDMTGVINIGTGTVQVHDIFQPLPEFMKEADCIFIDPPCSRANLSAFYTKADMQNEKEYVEFKNRLWECLDEIKPEMLFLELFKSNQKDFIEEAQRRYKYVDVYNSTYYHKASSKCVIVHCHNDETAPLPIEGMDEEDVIKWIAHNIDYKCIGDLCMGRGLVGYFSNEAGKKFVGTELNKKRLAILLDMINNGTMKGYH